MADHYLSTHHVNWLNPKFDGIKLFLCRMNTQKLPVPSAGQPGSRSREPACLGGLVTPFEVRKWRLGRLSDFPASGASRLAFQDNSPACMLDWLQSAQMQCQQPNTTPTHNGNTLCLSAGSNSDVLQVTLGPVWKKVSTSAKRSDLNN